MGRPLKGRSNLGARRRDSREVPDFTLCFEDENFIYVKGLQARLPGLFFYGTSSIELDKRQCIIDSLIINLISHLVIRTHPDYCIIQFIIGIFLFEFLVAIGFEVDSLKYKITP